MPPEAPYEYEDPPSPPRRRSPPPRPRPPPAGNNGNKNQPPSPRRIGTVDKGEENPRAAPSPKRSSGNPLIDIDALLEAHNALRMISGAPNLTWSDDLAKASQGWADKCIFEHSRSRTNGENLAALSGTRNSAQVASSVGMWTGEVCYYNFDRPGFDSLTGHYTQVVWKGTQQIGCGYRYCEDGLDSFSSRESGILVCQYYPPGNWNTPAYFRQNVQKPNPMPDCTPQWPFAFGRRAVL
ncbi:hypothetical protein HYH03_017168 [Edaphochlamys debaryana]|uniref:SCP domain-containing protein n=1 Tax=Edaphochlamys debaryana TaxID=47281 RepID=A0A836BP63_9CHLO|nr:hypothetical protein HYH03_017168 [Edaphochlamys debaryana]|eukprot:KAG2484001.1 hypothetical protein HYH03_017168 [Edaphochlamys debaryana]